MDIQERITSIINEQDAFRVVKLISFYDSLVAELHLKIEYLNKLNYTIQFEFKGLPEKIENTQEEIRQIYSAILFINGLFRIENLTENIKQVTLPDNIQRDFNLDKYLKDLPNLDNYKSVSKPDHTGEPGQVTDQPEATQEQKLITSDLGTPLEIKDFISDRMRPYGKVKFCKDFYLKHSNSKPFEIKDKHDKEYRFHLKNIYKKNAFAEYISENFIFNGEKFTPKTVISALSNYSK